MWTVFGFKKCDVCKEVLTPAFRKWPFYTKICSTATKCDSCFSWDIFDTKCQCFPKFLILDLDQNAISCAMELASIDAHTTQSPLSTVKHKVLARQLKKTKFNRYFLGIEIPTTHWDFFQRGKTDTPTNQPSNQPTNHQVFSGLPVLLGPKFGFSRSFGTLAAETELRHFLKLARHKELSRLEFVCNGRTLPFFMVRYMKCQLVETYCETDLICCCKLLWSRLESPL